MKHRWYALDMVINSESENRATVYAVIKTLIDDGYPQKEKIKTEYEYRYSIPVTD